MRSWWTGVVNSVCCLFIVVVRWPSTKASVSCTSKYEITYSTYADAMEFQRRGGVNALLLFHAFKPTHIQRIETGKRGRRKSGIVGIWRTPIRWQRMVVGRISCNHCSVAFWSSTSCPVVISSCDYLEVLLVVPTWWQWWCGRLM